MAKKKSTKNKPNFSSKRTGGKQEVNPFELKINKQRHSVLGRKLKNDKGMPGVSRSRAMKRRAEMFKKSSVVIKKSNAFIDRRIGECNDELSKEDIIIERMTLARKKKYKKDIYNLNDEEALTHYGQPLSEIEKFDEPEEDSDDDQEDAQLNADYVDKAHFGGFLTRKDDGKDGEKTHKEIIGDLILESKKRKEERKVEKDMTDDLTEQLDKEWKNFHSLLRNVNDNKESTDAIQCDPYDMAVKELKFEPRAKPANLVKSAEELEKAELAKLKKLEEERFERMQGDKAKTKVRDEFSADSIYDGLDIEDDILPELTTETQDTDEEEGDAGSTTSSKDNKTNDESDIANFSSDDETFDDHSDDLIKNGVSVDVPENLEQLTHLLSGKSKDEASRLIGNIITMNHPSRNPENKQKLDLFFCILLKFVNRISCKNELEFLDILTPRLFSLTQIPGLKTGLIFKKFVVKKISDYEKVKTANTDFPSLDILVTLKLAAILYPTSDYRHQIITPVMLMMSDILCSPYKVTLKNILLRLFVSCLFYEYVAFSKRLAVEPLVFLETVLCASSNYLSSNKHANKKLLKTQDILLVDSQVGTEPSSISLHLLHNETKLKKSAELKVSILFCAVTQLQKFAEIYCVLPSFQELFSKTKILCEYLPINLYPKKLSTAVLNLKEFLNNHVTVKNFLTFPKKKPKMLKMFEPRFEMNANDKKMTLRKKVHLEKSLSQKIKREEKSILREQRRNAQFVAQKHLEERMEADAERKRKVKQIYQELSIQQGEYKKFAKNK